ncbi:MAG: CPBP family intramembrane metalloprotease [Candidatus Nomurabacteria bacterium]|jgi:membrane protease YdiL (CAAX protease family)|nr:CPBP family intramembrane metalloprotease [Candidatus Nomurabacteria bacterium]
MVGFWPKFWKTSKAVGFWVLWVVTCYFLVQLLISILVGLLAGQIPKGDVLFSVLGNITMYILMLALAVGLPLLIKKQLHLGKVTEILALTRRPRWGDLGKAVLIVIYYFSILFTAMFLLMCFFPDIYSQEQELGFSTTGNSVPQLVLVFFSLVIVAPVAEELIMRGLLFGKLRQNLPFWPAAIIVSALFALAHGQINVGVDTFILSLFLCWSREKTGAIYTPILIHMLKNLLGFVTIFGILA